MTNVLRRMSEEELPTVLSVLAAAGGTSRSVESWRADRMTGLVLGEKGSVSAVMPMARRTVQVAPGRTMEAGWLSSNQFASRMGLRRQTRETSGQWGELLPELDALLVVRRDEGSLAGRWYGQTGFHEVLSIRCLYLDMEAAPDAGAGQGRYRVEVVNAGKGAEWDAGKWQGEMLGVYREVYAACGGMPVRGENYWRGALAHHYYGQHYQFQIVGLWGGGNGEEERTLMGYAVIGWSGWHSKRPRMDILEIATRQWDTPAASELLRTTAQLAWSKGVRQVRAVISAHDPYRSHLTRSGFMDRWGYVMLAKWLQAQRYVDRVGKMLEGEKSVGGLTLRVSSPGEMPLRMEVRGAGGGGQAVFNLQGDGRTVTRMLLDRLDVAGALQGGDGTLFAAESGAVLPDGARLAMAFPWTPWVFHMIDYI